MKLQKYVLETTVILISKLNTNKILTQLIVHENYSKLLSKLS